MMRLSSLLRRCGAALLTTTVAVWLCRLLEPGLAGPAAYLLFTLAVLVSGRVGGGGSALLATLLGVLAGLFLVPQSGHRQASDVIAAGLFLLVGAGIANRGASSGPGDPGDGASRVEAGVRGGMAASLPGGRFGAWKPFRPGTTAALTATLEAARQERDAERRLRRQLAVLHEVSLQLSALSSRDDLCREAVEIGRRRLGFDRLGLWLQLDEPGVIHGSFGTDEQGRTRDERSLRLPVEVIPLAAKLLDGSARVLRRDGATLYGDRGNPVGRGTHVLAGLWNGDRFIGLFAADNLITGRPISGPESELLGLYAATIGHLCTRMMAEEALRESRDVEHTFRQQLATLHDISLDLAAAPDFDALCRRAVELGRSRLGFDRLGLWFRTEQPDRVRGSFGTNEAGQMLDEREARLSVLPGTPTERILSGEESVVRVDDTDLFSWMGEEVRGTQVVAGLWNGQRAIGYLSADNRLLHRPITEQQQALLGLYAATLGHLCTLMQRQQALHEADRRKDRSLAMLAHELRNPLAPIKNAVELLKAAGEGVSAVGDRASGATARPDPRSPTPDTLIDRLLRATAVIDRQVRHQARLLDELLDLSRIGQGKIELHRRTLDLARLIRDAAEDRRGVLAAAGLTLALELPDQPVWVAGDATRLAQVVGNLLANAGKFTPPGGQVTVGCRPDSDPTPSAVVTVRDTGIGIEAEMLPRVFDAFTQADRTMIHSQGGLGLGLALVRGLVERHGGGVRAESDGPGRGARFTVTLPLAHAPAAPEPARPAAPLLGGPLRILIIEDHPDAAETLRELLELFGCTVEVARTGLEGIETAPRFRPEVVLCDLGLPQLDGYGVAAALRTIPEMAHVRLIALSGHGQEEDQRRAREAGFDLHLTKPIDFDELRQLLEVAPTPRGV